MCTVLPVLLIVLMLLLLVLTNWFVVRIQQ